MCGIAGILSYTQQPPNSADIRNMTNALVHRGPDAEGFYSDEKIALGHRRLSIIDLSIQANQPFVDNSGRFVIVFNGEIYNFIKLREQLNAYQYKTVSDTEVLLATYIEWGANCVHHLKGMYAFAIWDKIDQTLFLCRDRLGVKPLYYFSGQRGLVFASELRSILKSGFVEGKLQREALFDFLSFQSFNSNLSAIQGVQQLKPGSYMLISNGAITRHTYWDASYGIGKYSYPNENVVKQEVLQLFRKSVASRMVSDIPIGVFLSGGIDSSSIVAIKSEVSAKQLSTFHVAFEEKGFDESRYAKLVADRYLTDHHEIRISKQDLLSDVEKGLLAMDTPSIDGLNTYFISKAIKKQGISVALSGIGSDELFCGYPFFKQYAKVSALDNSIYSFSFLRRLIARALIFSKDSRKQRMASILRAEKMSIPDIYPEFRRLIMPSSLHELLKLKWDDQTQLERTLKENRSIFEGLPPMGQISLAEYFGYTQHTLLQDTDQMSMAVALEVREPFFDHELIEYVIGIPDALKKPQVPKSLLIGSLSSRLPKAVINRRKKGFLFPWNIWLRNELTSFCEKRIRNISGRDFIHAEALNDLWRRFLKNDPLVKWTDIWAFVVLDQWMESNGIE